MITTTRLPTPHNFNRVARTAGDLVRLFRVGCSWVVPAALTEQFSGRTLLLGVDRLDYTKGIVERLLAVELLLERNADLRTSLAFLQIAVPSRDNVREYRQLRDTVEQHRRR